MVDSIRIGELVQSLSGHDKGQYFLVTDKEGVFLRLCDGKTRKAQKCKKKKQKHVRGTGVICPWVAESPERVNNTSVRRALGELRAQGEFK